MAWKFQRSDCNEPEKEEEFSDSESFFGDSSPHQDYKLLLRHGLGQTHNRNSMCWDDFFGSSLDLAPTLLTIYDNIAAASGTVDANCSDQTDGRSKSLPASATVRESRGPVIRVERDNQYNKQPSKMTDPQGSQEDQLNGGGDSKKRPLSISSSSSASSSSLPRHQRKRPNLADYDHLLQTKSDKLSAGSGSNQDCNGNTKISEMDYENSDVGAERSVMEEDKKNDSYVSVSSNPDDTGDNFRGKTSPCDKPEFSQCSNRECIGSVSPATSPGTGSVSSAPGKTPVLISPSGKLSPEQANHARSTTRSPSLKSGGPVSPSHRSHSSPGSPKSSSMPPTLADGSKPTTHYVSYVQRVVSEIVETERTYVKSLEDIIEGYMVHLEKVPEGKVAKEDLECLFSNIKQIYDFSRVFLWELENCNGEPVCVAECFVRNNEGFVIYTDYCTNYPSAVEVLTQFMMDPRLSEMFKHRQLMLGHGLPLGAYLLRPVQRILKYHLLLQNILKFFDKEKPGYSTLEQAFKHMTGMAMHINEMKRKHEHAVRIQEIQSQLEDYAGEDLTCLGELVLEGSFRVYGAKASRQVFLFEKEILISKKKEGGMLGCKASIQLANLMLVEIIPNEPLSFHVIPFDNPRAQYTLQARNMEQKRRWCQEIKRLILETYKGKIPDKVKSLVMELGRNHDDDYVNSESMDPRRHHHTAPEYLERRRVRRKSGSKIPDFGLLKPQRAKRANRKNDTSPRMSPVMDRKSNLPANTQRETAHDIYQRRHTLEEPLSGSSSVSRTLANNDFKSQSSLPAVSDSTIVLEKPSETVDDCVIAQTSPKERANIEKVRRAKSFRKATRMRPVHSQDLSDLISKYSVQQNGSDSDLDDPNLTRDDLEEYNDYVFDSRSSFDELSDDDQLHANNKGPNKYSSMPLLNDHQAKSSNQKERDIIPQATQDVGQSKSTDDIEHQIRLNAPNIWKKTKPKAVSDMVQNRLNNTKNRNIPAFHDTFAKKSRENLVAKGLYHPKATKHLSVEGDRVPTKRGCQAKLTNWASSDKLTKGSMSDLSHLSEDPWIKNPEVKKMPTTTSASSVSISNSWNRPRNCSDVSDVKCTSKENIDWMVYVNRNSLNENPENLRFLSKYCTPPRGSMTPPQSLNVDKQIVEQDSRMSKQETTLGSFVTPPRPYMTSGNIQEYNTVSTTSSLTLPSIVVSASPSSSRINRHEVKHHLSRSNSTPAARTRIDFQTNKSRPASLDCDVVTESERMVAEMEDYIKNSSSDSSFTNRFPTILPVLNYDDVAHTKRLSSISTSSYDSHSSSSSEGLMETLKHKFHNFTSKITSKKMDDSDPASVTSSISDVRPSSLVISDDEKLDDVKNDNKYSSDCANLPNSKRTSGDYWQKGGKRHPKQLLLKDHDLQTFLRQRGLGGGSIGSRMAHSLPPNVEALISAKIRPHSACVLRGDNDSLSSYELSSKEGTPEPQTRFSLPPAGTESEAVMISSASMQQCDSGFSLQSDVTDSADVQQCDSGFSVQGDVMDSVSEENILSPVPPPEHKCTDKVITSENEENKSPTQKRKTQSESSADSFDSFYERRLSLALDADVFRDSAVFCDIAAEPKPKVVQGTRKPRKSIREFVQILEERHKPKQTKTFEVKRREPGFMIRQKLQHLQEAATYNKRASRPSSEERELQPPKSVRDIQASLVSDIRQPSKHSMAFSALNYANLNMAGNSSLGVVPSNISSVNSSSNTSISSNCSSNHNSALSAASIHSGLSSNSNSHISVLSGNTHNSVTRSNQFMHHHGRAESEHGLESSPATCGMQPAHSLGRLDQLSTDIENLVIMKGWVRQLVSKFQSDR